MRRRRSRPLPHWAARRLGHPGSIAQAPLFVVFYRFLLCVPFFSEFAAAYNPSFFYFPKVNSSSDVYLNGIPINRALAKCTYAGTPRFYEHNDLILPAFSGNSFKGTFAVLSLSLSLINVEGGPRQSLFKILCSFYHEKPVSIFFVFIWCGKCHEHIVKNRRSIQVVNKYHCIIRRKG